MAINGRLKDVQQGRSMAQTFLCMQADVVFLSPPWGGLSYRDKMCFHVTEDFGGLGMNLSALLEAAVTALYRPWPHDAAAAEGQDADTCRMGAAGVVACFLPRHSSLQEIAKCCSPVGPCIAERAYLNKQLKAVTVYLTPSIPCSDVADIASPIGELEDLNR